jgi:methyl-accepting chemotaxis protein
VAVGGWFRNLKTGSKLLLAFGTAVSIAIVVGMAGRAFLARLEADARTLSELNRGPLRALVRVRLYTENALSSVGTARNPGGETPMEPAERATVVRNASLLVEHAQKVLADESRMVSLSVTHARARVEGESGADALGTVSDLGANLQALKEAVAVLPQQLATTPPPGRETVHEALQAVLIAAQKLDATVDAMAASVVREMERSHELGRQIMLIGAGAGALLVLLVGVVTTRIVVEPLREMTAAAHRISEGDLTAEITHRSEDEAGALAESFRRMQQSLRDLAAEAKRVASGDLSHGVRGGGELADAFNAMIVGLSALLREIRQAGEQMKDSSSTILGGVRKNAEGGKQEAEAAERVRGSMERLAESARDIAGRAGEVERVADAAMLGASQGTTAVGSAVDGIFRVRGQVGEISARTLVLAEKTRRIGEVLKIIQAVAGEIHMLALNAAIEAASSAGEGGKRFAVVAGEVRRLADRTRQATDEIRSVLLEIQEASEGVESAASQGAAEANRGAEDAGRARKSMEEVIASIHRTAEAARAISRATQEQRLASEQVSASMSEISNAVRRMARGSEESTQAVQDLAALATRFETLTGSFRTG